MGIAEHFIGFALKPGEHCLAALGGIGADVLKVLETCCGDEKKGDGVGVFDADCVAPIAQMTAGTYRAETRFETQPQVKRWHVVFHLPGHRQRVGGDGCRLGNLVRAVHFDGESQLARLVGRETYDDDVVGIAGKNFTLEIHAGDAIGGPRDGGVEIELAAIVRDLPVVWEMQAKITERLIRLLANRVAEKLLPGEGWRLL